MSDALRLHPSRANDWRREILWRSDGQRFCDRVDEDVLLGSTSESMAFLAILIIIVILCEMVSSCKQPTRVRIRESRF